MNNRNPHLMVYGSSYDRGLEHALNMWPDIRKSIPDAELHIFYGWHLFAKFYTDNPERMAWMEKMNKLMEQPGITHLGRISQEGCVKEMENAAIWFYPTHFGEISCITAMRAQVYGAIPVVVDYAALEETVQYGAKVKGDIYDKETKDEFKKQLIDLLKDEKRQGEIREPMMKWAREKFAWSAVAKQWTEEFRGPLSLEKQIDELMEDNQPLKAWDLVKDTDSPLKDKVYAKVRHAFEPEEYKKFYSENLEEKPTPQGSSLPDRFEWLLNKLDVFKPETLCDLGCADGVIPLIMAKRGVKTVGVNLYQPSVDYATAEAKKRNLDATFICQDLFDHEGQYDAIVLMEVLEHLPDPQKGIGKCMSLLKKGGRLYLSTPRTDHLGVELHKNELNHKKWDEDGTPSGHLKLYTEEELRDMFREYKILDFNLDNERCMELEVVNV